MAEHDEHVEPEDEFEDEFEDDVVDEEDFGALEDGEDNPLGIPDEETLEDLLRLLSTRDAPRVFALCEVAPGWRQAGIYAWGMSFPDRALLWGTSERFTGSFNSAESALARLGYGRDLRLIWPDFVPLRETLAS
ncbi:hypothetical protein EV193_104306 [Herbihabitans rhizosphaerae]|uniref:Uncharacterized protein n=1 Tax=Herbihabitans rhizosphaerae TaxID=1872711 RepID=A0A4Q7KRC2_9PSEU|nr:hypothetical protein [Herbihabitans rhizosphaerae]RZS39095.1 hypothetical protein EV193_104306 [Herbihabitans rhizosphaerae]